MMRKILPVIALLGFVLFQNVSGQTDDFLASDLKQVDVAAYVDIKEVISVASSDKETDCENFKGIGYCSILLRAEIKELYKGEIKTKTLEFFESGEAQSIRSKKQFLGERLIFLEKFREGDKTYLQTLENSTRRIEGDILKKMQKIARGK